MLAPRKSKMRIGCLQFAPRVADVDSNLDRADAVLSRADPADLDSLDLLVVPEMAFSGEPHDPLTGCSPEHEVGSRRRGTKLTEGQATTSRVCTTSRRSSSMKGLESARSGPAPWPSATTAMSSLAIPNRSTFLTSGQPRPSITTPP